MVKSKTNKKEKKSGWVWWVVFERNRHENEYDSQGPYDSHAEACRNARWSDKIVRKGRNSGPPEGTDAY